MKLDKRGFIEADTTMRTTNSNIYAAGDVVSKKWMLETLAVGEGVVVGINMNKTSNRLLLVLFIIFFAHTTYHRVKASQNYESY